MTDTRNQAIARAARLAARGLSALPLDELPELCGFDIDAIGDITVKAQLGGRRPLVAAIADLTAWQAALPGSRLEARPYTYVPERGWHVVVVGGVLGGIPAEVWDAIHGLAEDVDMQARIASDPVAAAAVIVAAANAQ